MNIVKQFVRWSEAAEERLEALWATGLSASQVGTILRTEKLGTWTRSAILGKINRMGMHGRERPTSPMARVMGRPPQPKVSRGHVGGSRALQAARERSQAPKPAAEPRKARDKPTVLRSPVPQAPTPIRKVDPADIPATARPWITRRFGECAFPVGGEGAETMSCCGSSVPGKSYCADHCAVMFTASKPIRTRSYQTRKAA